MFVRTQRLHEKRRRWHVASRFRGNDAAPALQRGPLRRGARGSDFAGSDWRTPVESSELQKPETSCPAPGLVGASGARPGRPNAVRPYNRDS